MYSVQDERLDPLKRKSSSVYIVESDNDFFWCVIQANKQFCQSFQIFFFFSLVAVIVKVPLHAGIMYVCISLSVSLI